ncbi:neuropeptides capa receptor [Esox lucius]|uniref:neuropeptides capa receptor n=1 Tax=Esox lucius TaxID=8010 RepID=UPI0014775744|nr:neuropeptides capa receptor [Esox lucius]XP_019907061.2 neuropeptides capa receptor [Esox lucius]
MEDLELMEPSNQSCSWPEVDYGQVLNVFFMLFLSVAITLGNAVSLTIFLGSRHFRTPQGYLKASLATADLSVGVLVIPYSIYTETETLLAGREGSQTKGLGPCFLIGPIFSGCTLVSVSTIFLLSVERGITVLKPLHKNLMVTRERTLGLITLSWLFCFLLAVSPLILSDSVTLEYNLCSKMCNYALSPQWQCYQEQESTSRTGWSVMLLFPAFDISLLGATIVVNLVTLAAIRRFCRVRRRALTKAHPTHSGPTFSHLRAAKTILILTAFLLASVAPTAVLVVASVLGLNWCRFSLYAFWALACSSGWNVLIYSAQDRRFRQRVRELFLGRRGTRRRTHQGAEPGVAPAVAVIRNALTPDITLTSVLTPEITIRHDVTIKKKTGHPG